MPGFLRDRHGVYTREPLMGMALVVMLATFLVRRFCPDYFPNSTVIGFSLLLAASCSVLLYAGAKVWDRLEHRYGAAPEEIVFRGSRIEVEGFGVSFTLAERGWGVRLIRWLPVLSLLLALRTARDQRRGVLLMLFTKK